MFSAHQVSGSEGRPMADSPRDLFLPHQNRPKGNPKTIGFWRRSFPHFFRCWKKWGRRRQKLKNVTHARRRGPPHSSLYPWLRIKFTLSRQFSLTFTHVSMYTLVPMNFSMSRRARELMRLSISPPLPMIMPLWLAFSQ